MPTPSPKSFHPMTYWRSNFSGIVFAILLYPQLLYARPLVLIQHISSQKSDNLDDETLTRFLQMTQIVQEIEENK